MKITISGPAAALNFEDDTEILEPQVLRDFHGIKTEDSCIDYLEESLAEIGLIGGHLEIVFDESSQRLRVCTIYHSPRTLKKKELNRLVEETRGQWSDGIGEGGFETGNDDVEIDAFPMSSSIDLGDIRVEQIDDGVKVPKPRKSPLLLAAKKNDVGKIAKLLDDGEPVDARDRLGNTPLMTAVRENQIEAAQLLIERGAQLNVADKDGSNVPVWRAAMFGYNEILEALLKAGADPQFVDPRDYTEHYPLHIACNRQQPEAVRLLVQHGADVNLACSSGYTPIMHLKADDIETARFLIEHGADIDAKNAFDKGMNDQLKQAIS